MDKLLYWLKSDIANLFDLLLGPISLKQMRFIQYRRMEENYEIFKNIVIKGVLTLLQYNRFLIKESKQLDKLIRKPRKY